MMSQTCCCSGLTVNENKPYWERWRLAGICCQLSEKTKPVKMKVFEIESTSSEKVDSSRYSSAGMTGVLVIMSVERDFFLAGF